MTPPGKIVDKRVKQKAPRTNPHTSILFDCFSRCGPRAAVKPDPRTSSIRRALGNMPRRRKVRRAMLAIVLLVRILFGAANAAEPAKLAKSPQAQATAHRGRIGTLPAAAAKLDDYLTAEQLRSSVQFRTPRSIRRCVRRCEISRRPCAWRLSSIAASTRTRW